MIKKTIFMGMSVGILALSTTANAIPVAITLIGMQQTGPAPLLDPGQRFALIQGTGTWTYDADNGNIQQTGNNTFMFGPSISHSAAIPPVFGAPPLITAPTVGYVLNLTGMNITGAGATTASAYSCTNGGFLAYSSICGGYDYYGAGATPNINFTNDSIVVANATTCSRTIQVNDKVTAPPICLQNAFNNTVLYGSTGTNGMSVRDTSTLGQLKVRPSTFNLGASWGQAGGGWELTFATVVPVPAAGWLLGTGLLGLAGLVRRKAA